MKQVIDGIPRPEAARALCRLYYHDHGAARVNEALVANGYEPLSDITVRHYANVLGIQRSAKQRPAALRHRIVREFYARGVAEVQAELKRNGLRMTERSVISTASRLGVSAKVRIIDNERVVAIVRELYPTQQQRVVREAIRARLCLVVTEERFWKLVQKHGIKKLRKPKAAKTKRAKPVEPPLTTVPGWGCVV